MNELRKELQTWLDKYYEKFKENYPLEQANELIEETIDQIKKCLEENKKREFEDVDEDTNF